MSDGAYRDDAEAALERADALERENEALRDKLERLEHPPPKPAPKPPKDYSVLVGPFIGLAALVAMISVGVYECRKVSTKTDRKTNEKLWVALVDSSTCLKNGLNKFSWEKYDAAKADPRVANPAAPSFDDQAITASCRGKLDRLIADDAYAPIASGMRAWAKTVDDFEAPRIAIADYYHHKDWKDDDYRSAEAKWSALRAAAARSQVAADAIRDRFLAISHAELRRFQQRWQDANGKDTTWWYLECGILLQLAADDYRMGDASKYEAEMTAFDARLKDAPLEVRRKSRDRTHKLEKSFYNELLHDRSPYPVP